MEYALDPGALALLGDLERAGYRAYLVGGCVRDLLRGERPHDWDICTSARPEEVLALFSGETVVPTGLRHGTVTVRLEHRPYEVTTFRVDGTYSDGRRPDAVRFTADLKEDLARRDFTINAMAMDAAGRLYDPFGGAEDLKRGLLRCVGDPSRRFQEDGLRILRGLRFAAVLGFSLEPETARSLRQTRDGLRRVAAERIQAELSRLLPGPAAGAVLRAFPEVFWVFWPELEPMKGFHQHSPWHCWDVWEHTLRALEAAPPDLVLRLAALLHDVGKPACFTRDRSGNGHFYGHPARSASMAEEMLRRLRFDHALQARVVLLVERHHLDLLPQETLLRRRLRQLGPEVVFQLLALQRADTRGQAPEIAAPRLLELDRAEALARSILAQHPCLTLKDLAVNGRDVLALGAAPGPAVGRVLQSLLEQVSEGALPNEREALLSAARVRVTSPSDSG